MTSSSTTSRTAHGASRWWTPGSIVFLCAAVLGGVMIGPAGPEWWRVPLELLNRLPFIAIDSGMSEREWSIVWQIRARRAYRRARRRVRPRLQPPGHPRGPLGQRRV